VPVYRNAEMLHELYRRLLRVLEAWQLSFEVLFVDDACPAGSLTVLKGLAQRDPRVAVLALKRNVGQHRAVLAGLAHVRGEWTVVMDADLQDPPEAIPYLLAKGQEGFAAVFAGRRGRYESAFRLFTSRLFKRLLHLLCGVPADACLFVALNRPMVERLLTLGGPHPFIVAMIGCTRLPLTSIPVVRARRPSGSSAYSFWGRLRNSWRAVAWVLAWKWHAVRRVSNYGMDEPPTKA
jgi:glycosyltransferase involved in cell wall biosynthesis